MARGQIDEFLSALEAAADVRDRRRAILDAAAHAMLRRPALGAQLVARLCAIREDAADIEDLAAMLGSGLDMARMESEGRKKRGDAVLAAAEEAVILAAAQGALDQRHRFAFGRIWKASGLQAPAALELGSEVLETNEPVPSKDPAELAAAMDRLFGDLMRQSGGDALEMHTALTETFPAMPAELRRFVVGTSVTRPEPVLAALACLWLLDPLADLRLVAAEGLAGRLDRGDLSGDTLADLVVIRSWMPEDEARSRVDRLLRDAMRAEISRPGEVVPWTVTEILATIPDGGGAQSIGIALKSGRRRATAMVLIKQGYGVKDAYVVPATSAAEQNALMRQITLEAGGRKVTLGLLRRALARALADGLENGRPPVAGLIEVARRCGLTDLRPEPAGGPGGIDAAVAALPAEERDRLVAESVAWWDRHELVQSWFEDSDALREALSQPRSLRGVGSALWKWLETRRAWWAEIVARSAAVLEAAKHPDAASFAATALALRDGTALKKIPVMRDIHEQSMDVWLNNDAEEEEEDAAAEPEPAMEEPAPERDGELDRLLKRSSISADWIDGYLTAGVIAPKAVEPTDIMQRLLDAAITALDQAGAQRFVEIVVQRANAVITAAADPALTARDLERRSAEAARKWAAGFTAGYESFRASWPAKPTVDDRSVLRLVAEAVTAGFGVSDAKVLGAWIAARMARRSRRR